MHKNCLSYTQGTVRVTVRNNMPTKPEFSRINRFEAVQSYAEHKHAHTSHAYTYHSKNNKNSGELICIILPKFHGRIFSWLQYFTYIVHVQKVKIALYGEWLFEWVNSENEFYLYQGMFACCTKWCSWTPVIYSLILNNDRKTMKIPQKI